MREEKLRDQNEHNSSHSYPDQEGPISYSTQRACVEPVVAEIKAEYGFLDQQEPVVLMVQERLQMLLPEISGNDLPKVEVLAAKGAGINAFALPGKTIVLTPELIAQSKFHEVIDFILLHEYVHIKNGHLTYSMSNDSLLDRLGTERIQEYEADVIAFQMMSDPARHTNCLGAIKALEMLRDTIEQRGTRSNWDAAHGRITDRILNLKSLIGIFELDNTGNPFEHALLKELQETPHQLVDFMRDLPTRGSRLFQLLRTPPVTQGWRRWERQVNEVIDTAGLDLISVALDKVSRQVEQHQKKHRTSHKRTSGISTTEIILASYTSVLNRLIEKAHLILDEECADARSSDIGVAILTNGIIPDTFHKSSQVTTITKEITNTLRSLDRSQSKTLIRMLQNSPAAEYTSNIGRILADWLWVVAYDQAAFDTEEGFNAPEYLAEASELLNELFGEKESTTHRSAPVDRAWNRIVTRGALLEADYGSGTTEYGLRAMAIQQEQANGAAIDRNLITDYLSSDPVIPNELRSKVKDFLIEQQLISPYQSAKEVRSAIEQRIKSWPASQQFSEDTELLEMCREYTSFFLSKDSLSNAEREEVGNFGDLFTRAPIHIQEVGIRTLHILSLAPLSVDSQLEGIEGIWQQVRFSAGQEGIAELHALIDLNTSFEQSFDLFGLRVNRDLSSDKIAIESRLVQYYIEKRNTDLSIDSTLESDYLSCLRTLVREYAPLHQQYRNLAGSGALFLDKAIELTGEIADRQEQLTVMYDLSFFLPQGNVRINIQRRIQKELIEKDDYDLLYHLLFTRYEKQLQTPDLSTLEYLDRNVTTKDASRNLRSALEAKLQSGKERGEAAGQLIALEVFDRYAKRFGRATLLADLVQSGRSDKDLKERVEESYWLAAEDFIMSQISEIFANSKDEESLAQLFESNSMSNWELSLGNPATNIPYAAFTTVPSWGDRLHDSSSGERFALLRQLLVGEHGVLLTPGGREHTLELLFEGEITDEENRSKKILNDVMYSLVTCAPTDELSLVLMPILHPRIAERPKHPTSWAGLIQKRALSIHSVLGVPDWRKDTVDKIREKTHKSELLKDPKRESLEDEYYRSQRLEDPVILKHLSRYLSQNFYNQDSTDSLQAPEFKLQQLCIEEQPRLRDREELDPLRFAIELGTNLGAPGVRFLQLFGQFIEQLDDEAKAALSVVYDKQKGQTTMSALHTTEIVAPHFYDTLNGFTRKLGGGSLYTVFETSMEDDSTVAARILNPNALYRTAETIKVLRRAVEDLTTKNPQYQVADHIIDLIEEWIYTELADETYEQDDQVFYNRWNGWKPTEDSKIHIVLPKSYSTGTAKVRVDEYIEGDTTLTDLDNLPSTEKQKYRGHVALGIQYYFGQIMGLHGEEETLVHSDVSKGNYAITPEGNVAVLDRGMYLRFNSEDRAFLTTIIAGESSDQKAEALIAFAEGLGQNSQSELEATERAKLKEQISQGFEQGEGGIFTAVTTLQQSGLTLPLKYNLLIKNINAWRQMAHEVGFSSITEALGYL